MGANYIALVSLLLFSVSLNQVTCKTSTDRFTHCMHLARVNQDNIIYPSSPNFYNLFVNAQQNFRHLNNTKRPIAIVTPSTEAETQASVVCAKKSGLLCRPKSGGHDYENLSFEANEPYIMIDMVNQREIALNMTEETAWVQTGTTLGELYLKISSTNPLYAFPGGTCPSVGTGGYLSGGGQGMMTRKYGLGADNVLDARVINAKGEILDRKAMGEDYFWAIRGGGGGNFGVVTAWKLKLVRVPPKVTFFHKKLPMKQYNLPKIMAKYQEIAPYLPNEWVVRVFLTWSSKSQDVACSFNSQFLGPKEEALRQMTEKFPEMGLNETDVNDYPWINATLRAAGHEPTDPFTVFLNRTDGGKTWNKGKSDYLTAPISEAGIQGLLNKLNTSAYSSLLIFDPAGGKADEFASDALPFPHRKGTLFNIQYLQFWNNNTEAEAKRNLDFINDVYAYMEPHVSNNPRAAYVNYKDLALGQNPPVGNATYSEAKVWGERYFKGNFERLAKIKSMVDPENYFRSAQSIPLYQN